MREGIGASVDLIQLEQSLAGQGRRGDARVVAGAAGFHQALPLERAQQAAEITRIQAQPRPQLPRVGAFRADLVEQAYFGVGPAAAEEIFAQDPEPPRDLPIETSKLANLLRKHYQTLVR